MRVEMRQGVPGGGGGEGRLRRPVWLEEEAADGVPSGGGGEGRLRRLVHLEEETAELDSKGAHPRSLCSAVSLRKQVAASRVVWRLEEAAA
jgi:hypothetical protein